MSFLFPLTAEGETAWREHFARRAKKTLYVATTACKERNDSLIHSVKYNRLGLNRKDSLGGKSINQNYKTPKVTSDIKPVCIVMPLEVVSGSGRRPRSRRWRKYF